MSEAGQVLALNHMNIHENSHIHRPAGAACNFKTLPSQNVFPLQSTFAYICKDLLDR